MNRTTPFPRPKPTWLLLLLAGLLALWPASTQGATGSWSPPVEISGNVGGWFPTVAADDAGNVHVVWNGNFADETTHEIGALYYARGNGRTWTTPNDIALIWVGHALRSSLQVDRSGVLHLIYKGFGELGPEALGASGSLGQEDLWYTEAPGARADSVRAWQPASRLTRSAQGYYSDLAIDRHGTIHAIWTETTTGAWGIYYANSHDGGMTWSERVALDESSPVWWYRAHLKIDENDHLHVVWEQIDPAEMNNQFGVTIAALYAQSVDGGRSWTKVRFGPAHLADHYASPDRLELNLGAGPQQPAIGIDGHGTILFVYRDPDTNQILFRTSTDGTHWAAPVPIPGITAGVKRPYDIYDMVTDSAGHVHLAAVGYPTGSPIMSLLHSEWDGRGWSTPAIVVASPPYPEYPKLALSQGNKLHLVWFDGDRPSIDRTQIGIWYSSATTTAPALPDSLPPAPPSRPRAASAGEAAPRGSAPRAAATPGAQAEGATFDAPWLPTLGQHPDGPVVEGLIPVSGLIILLVLAKLVLPGLSFARRTFSGVSHFDDESGSEP